MMLPCCHSDSTVTVKQMAGGSESLGSAAVKDRYVAAKVSLPFEFRLRSADELCSL